MNDEPKPDTPFPRHRYYYIALKFAVILAAFALAIFVFGQFW
jgi:hypothetical protein